LLAITQDKFPASGWLGLGFEKQWGQANTLNKQDGLWAMGKRMGYVLWGKKILKKISVFAAYPPSQKAST
jgi:hypothetical protein